MITPQSEIHEFTEAGDEVNGSNELSDVGSYFKAMKSIEQSTEGPLLQGYTLATVFPIQSD